MKQWNNRNNIINNCINNYVNLIIQYCKINKVNTIVMGNGYLSQKQANLGKQTNQNFCMIPYGRFKDKLVNKCNLFGINFILQEQSYTSKCDHLSLQQMCKQNKYLGKRVHRGLFKSYSNKAINADVNGSIGIMRKYYKAKGKDECSLIENIVSRGLINRPRVINLNQIQKNGSINTIVKISS